MLKRLMSIGVAVVITGGVIWLINEQSSDAPAKDKAITNGKINISPKRAQAQTTKLIGASQDLLNASALILSGTGEPGITIELRGEAKTASQTVIDEKGAFTLNLTLPSSDAPDGHIARYEIASPKAGESAIVNDSALIVARAPDTQLIAALLCSPGGSTQVLRSPFSQGSPEANGLTFISGDYDNAGGVIFSGRSTQAGRIRILANRSVIGETGLADDGSWVLIAGSTLPVGLYRLTVQRIDASANVNAQMVLPFERKAPMPAITDEAGITLTAPPLSVQFTDDSWHINRALHGGGRQHTVIYSALALVP